MCETFAVQLMSSGKVVGCGTGSDGCGAFNWCCDGYHCSNLLSGGVCEQGNLYLDWI